jgi:surfeit locus 1 family protein
MKRFPVGLTVATAVAVAILLGLGTWQVQRMSWKTDLVARVEAARTAPPVRLAEAVERADGREDLAFLRVRARCELVRGTAASYSIVEGQIAWRALAWCDTEEAPLLVERGVVRAGLGRLSPPDVSRLPPPTNVVGVLRPLDGEVRKTAEAQGWTPLLREEGCADARPRCFPYYLSVEAETPAVAALRPAPLPPRLSNNHLGYAITWYGFAAALVGVYVALLRNRLKS